MPADTLSQNEIDAILGGGGGASAARTSPAPRDVHEEVYDFRRPHRISKDRLRTIEAMYERLAKQLEAWLIGRVRRQIELKLQSVEQYSFGEFTLSLSTPCASFGFDIANNEGQKGVIDMGHELAYLLIDRFFGGDSQPATPRRALSPIERLAIRGVVDRVASLVTEIWQDHVPLDLELTTFESFPEMVQGVNREDPVLVANIDVSGDQLHSLLIICLPLSVLEKFFASGDQRRVKEMTGSPAERRATRELTEASLRTMHVDVSARLPAFTIRMRQLLSLPPGSVLTTGVPTDTPLELLIGGRARYLATPGRVGQRVAVRVADVIRTPGAADSADALPSSVSHS
ncbi:MAG TPA: FliM/FliN family flagellar motor switch protein [Gemmatimonadaceae bacterium]|nr:FliM/FliN family flagellar motor switch protein [Gemmatimonadaceae bacterium]